MPNPIKYTTGSETLALKKGNFYIGTGDVGKGPSNTTGYYNGVSPSSGGYVIYLKKSGAPGDLSYHSAANDSELISFTNNLAGQSFTSATQCLVYYAGQTDKVCLNRNYEGIVTDGLVLNLDAGFTPSYPRSGTTWYDISLSGNTGTLTNGPTFNSDNGGSIVFDGSDDYINCGNNSSLNSIVSYTVSTWINFPNVSRNYGPIFCRHNRGTISSDIEIYGGNGGITLAHNRSNGGNFGYFYAIGPNNNTPALFSVTYTSNTWKTYINGSLSQTITNPSGGQLVDPLVSAGYVTDIGQFYDGPYFALGTIYLQQVYNRELTASEIIQNYNAQKGRFGL